MSILFTSRRRVNGFTLCKHAVWLGPLSTIVEKVASLRLTTHCSTFAPTLLLPCILDIPLTCSSRQPNQANTVPQTCAPCVKEEPASWRVETQAFSLCQVEASMVAWDFRTCVVGRARTRPFLSCGKTWYNALGLVVTWRVRVACRLWPCSRLPTVTFGLSRGRRKVEKGRPLSVDDIRTRAES